MKNSLLGSILQGLFVGAVFGLFGIVSHRLKKRTEERLQKKKDAGMTDEQIAESEDSRNSKQLYIGAAIVVTLIIGLGLYLVLGYK